MIPPTTEPAALTTFLMFEPDPADATRWLYRGNQQGHDRDHAARQFWPDRTEPFVYSAVSTAAWKPRRRVPRVVTQGTTVDYEMPDPTLVGEAPEPNDPPAVALVPDELVDGTAP